jgi:hypothetical protein
MNCNTTLDNILLYIDNVLAEEERIQFESHLQECTECEVLYKNIAATYNIIETENQLPASPFFYHKLITKLEAKKENRAIRMLPIILKPLAVAASIALGVMIGNDELAILNIEVDDSEIVSESFTPILPADYSLWVTMNEDNGSEN